MAKRTFEKIAAGLREAIEVARGEAQPARLFVPPEIEVKSIRKNTGRSEIGGKRWLASTPADG